MAGFVRSYLKTQQAGLIQQVCHIDGDSLVSRARNNLTAEFLKSDCTHLLFIDTDIIFEPRQVKKLIEHAAKGIQIVAGLYPKKQHELAWVINTMDGETTAEDGLRRVKYAGTGFMLISRSVFERARNAYPHIAYTTDHGEIRGERETRWDFWRVGVHRTPDQKETEPGRYLSEDWYFCQMLEEMGVPVMVDMTIHTQHIGTIAYPTQEVPLVDKDGNRIEREEEKKPQSADLDVPESMTVHVRRIFDGEYDFENPIKNGDTIFDIGANCGGFTRWARLMWPDSPIVAFEPIKANFDLLLKNTEGIPEIQLVNQAVTTGSTTGMFAGKNNPGECSFFDLNHQDTEMVEQVETVNPSELPPAHFYKIDTEGSELDIIQNLDLSAAKAVVLEWHREDDHKSIQYFFESRGWELVRDDRRSRKNGIMAFVNPANIDGSDDNS